MKRPYGLGTVESYRGRFRARSPRLADGSRPPLGIFDTPEEANQILLDTAQLKAEAGLAAGATMTLKGYGSRFLDNRELGGVRDIANERSRWKNHIATAHFADWPMGNVEKKDINDWLLRLGQKLAADVRVKDPKKRAERVYRRKPRKIGPQTRKHCFNLLSQAFDAAVEDGHCKTNPCDGIDPPIVPKPSFDYLRIEEQGAIERCQKIEEADRLRAMFAWGCGIRQYDQWVMKLSDLRLDLPDPDMIILCHKAGPRKPPKRIRVQLFGVALRALKRWLDLLPTYCPKNERGLVWPLPSGAQRQKSKDYGWRKMLVAAGVQRHVTWHELRDTCASSLLSGWWGRKWTLAEVKEMLVHSSIEVTERYAHFDVAVLAEAARETIGHKLASIPRRGSAKSRGNSKRATPDSDRGPSAPEAQQFSALLQELDGLAGKWVANSAALLVAQTKGEPVGPGRVTELANDVLVNVQRVRAELAALLAGDVEEVVAR